jgi:hypothetical protein
MAELTDREKKIVHSMNVMLNPALKDVPFDIKTKALQSVLLVAGYQWDENEMTDLMAAISAETKAGNQSALALLGKYGNMFKGLNKL